MSDSQRSTTRRVPISEERDVYMRDLAECRWNMTDCRAFRHGGCIALIDTKFNRPCPFYKRRDSVAKKG